MPFERDCLRTGLQSVCNHENPIEKKEFGNEDQKRFGDYLLCKEPG
jgi:hypothetical protein